MTAPFDLKPFIMSDLPPWMMAPWRVGPWRGITTGHVAIVVRDEEPAPPPPTTHENIMENLELPEREPTEVVDAAELRTRFGERERCKRCHARGRVTCRECDGTGSKCEYCHDCAHCPECEGTGKVECPCCSDGWAFKPDELRMFVGQLVNRHLLTWVAAALEGEVRVWGNPAEPLGPILMSCADDTRRIAVMPMRRETDAVVEAI